MGGYLIGTDPTLRKTKTPTVTALAAGVGFTAGTSTAITLGADPGSEEHVIVTMDGVTQHRSTYAISGTTLTFDAAIPTGTAQIEATFGVPVSSVTVPDNSVTLAKLAGGTDGNIISFDASGDPVAIATGTSGHFLKSQGAGAQPVFAADNGGSMTFINTSDLSSAATYSFTAVDASSYDGYGFFLQNVIPATDDVGLELLTSTDGGSSYDTGSSDYNWQIEIVGSQGADTSDNSIQMIGAEASAGYQIGSAANEIGVSGWIWLIGPHLTGYTAVHWDFSAMMDNATFLVVSGGGVRLSAANVDAIRILYTSGALESGTINAYGLANA